MTEELADKIVRLAEAAALAEMHGDPWSSCPAHPVVIASAFRTVADELVPELETVAARLRKLAHEIEGQTR